MADQTDKVKRPASQYYWGDWFKDVALQTCSLPARGLWHEMNCLMHQGEPYGHLTMPNGKPMQAAQLANLCKVSPGVCKKLIQELEDNGVLSRADTGAIFSRRMVRDEASREARAEIGRQNGVKGKDFGAMGAEFGAKGGRPAAAKNPGITPQLVPRQEPPQNPLPSSSSSSASSPSGNTSPTSWVPSADAADDSKPLVAKDLIAEGVDPQVAADWLKVRKAKKAPLTRTAWDGVKREADLAGMTPAQAVKSATENGWQGFKASWLQGKTGSAGQRPTGTDWTAGAT